MPPSAVARQHIYYAENQIVKALPKLIDKVTNRDLSKSLRDHLEETKKQIERLDQAFKKLGKQPEGLKCPVIAICDRRAHLVRLSPSSEPCGAQSVRVCWASSASRLAVDALAQRDRRKLLVG